ncbi:hypothetical protein PFFCH_04953 [Plasmodium falciparum FCH/4]|uniref:Uncharacterized protein n=1 Tax=Plasmodium falciparum FCH/4 TaxID=1036724 RepID=A0A024VHJ4_PLAFA|nr:hypothetical protein PFFCH_04953 [Plasmodium falciparum FCH/4]
MAHTFLKRCGCKEYDLFLKNKGKACCYFNFYKRESVHNNVVSNINNETASNENDKNDFSKNINRAFDNTCVNSYNNEKRKDLILHKSFSLLQNCNVKETIDILNIYIKLKNENIEFLKNICLNLLMNKEKIRHMEVLILLKKFSVIKCKDYYLFCYFKQILMDNMHVLNFEELVDIYFCYTNLNYFDYNFFFLIEKRIFHNFHKIDIKRLIMLIQCFNKKRIISRNYMTILLYSISKNMNNMNIFQLCVLFSFFKKFHINNTILISTLIHRFNYQVTINEAPKYISMFHNFLSYVKRKCVENYKVIEENKELLHMIQNGNEIFINKKNVGYENGQQILNNKLKEENNTMDNVHDDSPTNLVLFSKELKEIENNKYVVQCDELDKIREKTNDIKYNRYNMNILYIIQNSVKNIEMITRKHIKNMNVMSLCLLSCSISHINKNKYMLEQIAESLGKNSTKLCPSLVSSFLLSFSKCGHKHGPLIYYSLDFFYKYYNFFDMNNIGLFCKALHLFCIKENEFIDKLNNYMINNKNTNNNISNIIYDNMSDENHDVVSINNYIKNDDHVEKSIGSDGINNLCYYIMKKLDNDMSKLYYEDSNDYCHKDLLNNEKEKNNNYEDVININKKINLLYKNERVYNNQSYILILKGFMNILYQTKEKSKRNMIKNIMNSFVLFFKDYIYYMNEQDITLLLDIQGKCDIKNISLHKLIIDKLGKKMKKENVECLFYKLNPTSVCIILNNLYKDENKNISRYICSHIEGSNLLNKNDYTKDKRNNNLKNIIKNETHYMKTQPYIICPKNMKNKLYNAIISSNKKIASTDNKRKKNISQDKSNHNNNNNNNSNNSNNSNNCNNSNNNHSNNNNKFFNDNKKNNGDILFDKKDKYEVILFYTMSCYNYCNNYIIKIILEEIKNKITCTYNEKEICMFLTGVCNYIAVKKIQRFEKHCMNEEESINSINKQICFYYIHNIILKNNNHLIRNYSKFSIISLYILLSKLDYFHYYGRNTESWFLNKLFFNYNQQYDDIIRKMNDKRKKNFFFLYHFIKKKENITIKNIINLLFSLILNGHMNHSFYNILLQQMNFLIYDHLYNNINKEKEKENYNYILQDKKQLYYNQIHKEYYKDDHHIFKKIIQIVSLENIQILCIVYTYLYIYNILHKLNKNNLSLFLLFIQNCNYVNSFYISQHTTSKIHKEINDTIFSLIHKFILHQPLYEVMYKEKHIIKIIEALKYYDDNKKEDKNSDIYFYVLPKKTFSFIFNFSKYFLTYIFLRKNENFLKSYLYPIKTLPFYNDESIYIHVSCNLFNKRL